MTLLGNCIYEGGKNMRNKIMTFLLMFIALIGIDKVQAQSWQNSVHYALHPNSGFSVFAAESNGWMDYNSWMIKSSNDNRIYYCIDPAIELSEEFGAYQYYTGKENIIGKAKLTEARYKRIQLLAYYGYGYKDQTKDHTDKKWYGITQVMIWRVMRPELTWTFKTSKNGTPSNSIFQAEVDEIENLVQTHDKYPSFKDNNIKLLLDESKEIKDTNAVLENYNVVSKPNDVKISKNGNNLSIVSSKALKGAISFDRGSKIKEEFALLTSADYQDIVIMGSPDKKSFSFNIEVTGGVITLEKIDNDTEKDVPRGEASFEGAVYEIYDNNKKTVGKITTDKNGKGKISLDYGTYTLKEVKAPVGYNLSEEVFEVTLSKENERVTIKAKEKVKKGRLKIIKKKGGAGEEYKLEEGATFEIIDRNDKVIEKISTNKKGMAITSLPYGTYTIKQIKGAEGYAFVEDKKISLTDDVIYEIDLNNVKLSKLEFSKTDYSTEKGVPNTLIEIYKEDDTLLFEGRTDSKGNITLPGLEIGKYYILEKDAPSIYKLNEEKMHFEVKQNGEIIKCNMKNKRKEGNLEFKKQDSETGNTLANAEIEIVFEETKKSVYKGLTNEEGKIGIDKLVLGKYCIYERKAPDGYSVLKKPICFDLKEENEAINIVMTNSKMVKVPDTSEYKIIPLVGMLFMIFGMGIMIYEKKNCN